MRQMEWHEALDEAKAQRDGAALQQLEREVDAAYSDASARTGALLDAEDFNAAAHMVQQWMFLEKFSDDVAAAVERLAADR